MKRTKKTVETRKKASKIYTDSVRV